jgi:4-amino-4-deoxy-L-arabinose transferase-like glycosyltransferase
MTRPFRGALVLIVAVAAALRFYGIGFGLPYTQARPDETTVIDVALRFLSGSPSPRFYDYPTLFMFLETLVYGAYALVGMALGWFASLGDFVRSWPTHWAPFFLMSRSISAVSGIVSVWLVARMARQLAGDVAALSASALLAVAFLHVRDSHYGTTDTTMIMLALASLHALLQADEGIPGADTRAGLWAGLSAATKYNGILVAAALPFSLLRHWPQADRMPAVARRVWHYGRAGTLAFVLAAPFVFLEYPQFREAMALLQSSMASGMTRDIDNGWTYHVMTSLRWGVGWPLLATGVSGLLGMLIADTRRGAMVAAFPVLMFAVAGSSRNVFVRYMLPVVPFLCIGAGWLVATIQASVRRRTRAPLATAAAAVLVAALAAPTLQSSVSFVRILAREDTRVTLAHWMDATLPAGTSVLLAGSRYGHPQPVRWREWALWTWDRDRLRFLARGPSTDTAPAWVIMQESPLPVSVPQPEAVALLEEGYDLVHVVRGHGDGPTVYDRQDAFFVPYAGFSDTTHPGPNFAVYRRRAMP